MDERALVKACLSQHRDSQKNLYDSYSGQMYSICLRYMKEPMEAAEVLQQSFIIVFTQLHSFKFDGALGAWIRKIVVNACILQLKKRKRYTELFPELNESLYHHLISTDEESMTYREMLRYLETLPQGYRLVFSLYVLDDMSHAEIAASLNITEATSRSQLFKARKYLNELFTNKNIIQ